MTKHLLISMLLLVFTTSCSKDEPQNVMVDIQIWLTIENNDGEDLLNPATLNYIQEDDIKLYFDEAKQETCESKFGASSGVILDNPKGFKIIHPDVKVDNWYRIEIFSNPTIGEVLTIVEIKNRDDIKLLSEVDGKNGTIRVKKIWYLNNLVWPTESNDGSKFVKVKVD